MWLENPHRIWYEDNATCAKFLMGGIGTGNFSIGSRGQLCDWEIVNKPDKGAEYSYTFFAIRTEDDQGKLNYRLLESNIKPPYDKANGFESFLNAGIPRFKKSRIAGEVSCAMVELRDDKMPVDVDLYAFSPFFPLDADDSGIPGAILRYKVKNTSDKTLKVSLVGSLGNPVGYVGRGRMGAMTTIGEPRNTKYSNDWLSGIYFDNPKIEVDHLSYGNVVLATSDPITTKTEWIHSSYWNGAHDFWNDFITYGELKETSREDDIVIWPVADASRLRVGSICTNYSLAPGEEKEVEFVISWFFPNRPHRWPGHIFRDPDNGKIVNNYYTNLFDDAWKVANYLYSSKERLEETSLMFQKALYSTTLPSVILDAIASNINVLRSSSCFRIEDGTFLGWEGVFDHEGSCEGSCTHVWMYQQTLAFLFPILERDMRRVFLLQEVGESGDMAFRTNTVFGYPRYTEEPPATDGQLAIIVQVYRDWKLCGKRDFLEKMWPSIVKTLEYAIVTWDCNGDFVLGGKQHNTFDIDIYGENVYTNAIFYAALRAAEEMAIYLEESKLAVRYRKAYEIGSKKMDPMLFNGKYYIQYLSYVERHFYQFGNGCLANQLFGQLLAHIAGLGYILPPDHVRTTLKSIFHNNFLSSMEEHINVQRVYAINEEAGLVCCTWPQNDKPLIPFVYCDEVWTGFEYMVASHLIYEGMFEEALTLVDATRKRYDGVKRNPWSEKELGHHYVRSMASWGLLIASSGFGFDMAKDKFWFNPKVSVANFTCFYSTAKSWGLYRQSQNSESGEIESSIEVLYGDKEDSNRFIRGISDEFKKL